MDFIKKLTFAVIFGALGSFVFGEIPVVPLPAVVKEDAGKFTRISASTRIVCKNSKLAGTAAKTIGFWSDLKLETVPQKSGSTISIEANCKTGEVLALGKEGYTLEVMPSGTVNLRASTEVGAFYGIQTLAQLVQTNEQGQKVFPVVKIEDKPRFVWRGILLDEARYFFGKEAAKQLIDIMALHKMNVLHWHLTDDQGWRIEIKKYPKLTTVGGTRAESPIPGNRNKGDGMPHSGFYTQDDIREVVAYAAARYITVVPEIEIPGHSSAALAAYPEFGNTDFPGYNPKPETRWGVRAYLYAPKPETMQFLRDVLDEVCTLFPSKFIHIGGDEADKSQWKASPFAQEFIKKNGLKNNEELQSWFIRSVEKHLNSKGRQIVGWDEIQEGGLSPTATMMVWRDKKWATHAIERGNNVVMSPTSHCYLDYSPGKLPAGPAFDTIGGNVPLEKVYSFEPVPEGTSPEREKQVIGCQGNGWGEYFYTWPKASYLLFPRALAISEVAWSPREKRNFGSFEKRLPYDLLRLDRMKINYRKSDGSPSQPQLPMMR